MSLVGELLGFVAGERLELVELMAEFPGNCCSGSRASWVFGMLSVVEICQGLLVAVLLRILRMLVVSVVELIVLGGRLSLVIVGGILLLELVVVPTVIWSFVWIISELWSGMLVDIVGELLAVVRIELALVECSVVNVGKVALAK